MNHWFSKFVEIIPFVPYSCAPESPFLPRFFSDSVRRCTGYDAAQFQQPDFWISKIHPADRGKVEEALREITKCGHGSIEYRFLHSDGHYRWLRDSRALVHDPDGTTLEISGYWIDITDRKQAEEARLRSERRFEKVVENSYDAMALFNGEQKGVYASPAMKRMLGYGLEELVNGPRFDLFHPDDRLLLMDAWNELLAVPARVFRFEGRCRHKDGSYRWLEITMQNLLKDANVRAIVCNFRDISARKEAEEDLRESEARFRQLAENIEAVFWLASPASEGVLYASPIYETIWGRPLSELYEDKFAWMSSVLPEDLEAIAEQVKKARTFPVDFECRIARPNGEIRSIRCRTSPVCDQSGHIYRVAGIAEDITEFRRLETEVLQISEREQARISQDLHDGLGQHLTGIALLCRALQEKLEEKSAEETADILQIKALVDEAVKQTRTIARIGHPLELESEGLYPALHKLAAKVEEIFHTNCTVEIFTRSETSDPYVALHIYRIIQEAITNSIRHGKARNVCVRVQRDRNQLLFSVKDDGNGVPLPISDSAGMGLRIMKYRARMIHGSVTLSNDPDGGAVLSCKIPRVSSQRSPAQKSNSSSVGLPLIDRG